MKTVNIQPTLSFANGKQVTATQLTVGVIMDNLFDQAVFRYTLFGDGGEFAGESTFEIKGDAYTAWDFTAQQAFEIVANGIGLTIVPQVGKTFFGDLT
jgi:hypothetical protein